MSVVPTRPGSVTDNIVRLEVGQSFTMSRLIECEGRVGLAEIISNARNKLSSHMSRALVPIRQVHAERDYEIETGTMYGSRNNSYAVAIITRIADRDEL